VGLPGREYTRPPLEGLANASADNLLSAVILYSVRLAKLYGGSPMMFAILTQIEQGLSVLLREVRFSKAVGKLWETKYNTYEGPSSTSISTETVKSTARTRSRDEDDEEPLTETRTWAIRQQVDTDVIDGPLLLGSTIGWLSWHRVATPSLSASSPAGS